MHPSYGPSIYIHKGRMSIRDWPIAPLIISEASRTPIGRAERGEPNVVVITET